MKIRMYDSADFNQEDQIRKILDAILTARHEQIFNMTCKLSVLLIKKRSFSDVALLFPDKIDVQMLKTRLP